MSSKKSGLVTRKAGRPGAVLSPEQQSMYLQQMKRKKEKEKAERGMKSSSSRNILSISEPKKSSDTVTQKKGHTMGTSRSKSDDKHAPVVRSQSTPQLLDKKLQLHQVLQDPFLCGGYLLFLRGAFCEETLLCYKDVVYFESRFASFTPEEQIENAQYIVDLYLKADAEKEVNVSDFMRLSICEIVNKEARNLRETQKHSLKLDYFIPVREELFNLMKADTFMKYQANPLVERSLAVKQISKGVYKKHVPLNELTSAEWDIIMTGAKDQRLSKGDLVLTQGELNQYFYRLESGVLRVEKTGIGNRPPTVLTIIEAPGIVFGEMSIVSCLPASASIIAQTRAVVKKLPAKLILYFFLTLNEGPDIGRRFFMKLGITLSNLLNDITKLEPSLNNGLQRTTIASRLRDEKNSHNKHKQNNNNNNNGGGSSIHHHHHHDANGAISEFTTTTGLPVLPPARRNSSLTDSPRSARELFKKRFTMDEPVIESMESWIEKEEKMKKGTLYITSKHACFYSSSGQKKIREVLSYEELLVNPKGDKAFSLVTDKKTINVHFDNKISKDYCFKLLRSIIASFDDDPAQTNSSSDNDSSPLDNAEMELTAQEWDQLGNNVMKEKYLCVYFKGDRIMQEGSLYYHMYRIVSGRCRVEKRVPNPQPGEPRSLVLGYLEAGQIFGEVTFFSGANCTASLYAEELTELLMLDATYIDTKLFAINPKSVLKFYHFACATIASTICDREAQGWSRYQSYESEDETLTQQQKKIQFLREPRRDHSMQVYKVEYSEGDSNKFTPMNLKIADGFAKFYKGDVTEEPCKKLDLLEYSPLSDGEFTLSLFSNSNVVAHLRVQDDPDLVGIITQRINHEGVCVQSELIKNAPKDVLDYVEHNFQKNICNNHVFIRFGTQEWTHVVCVLRSEYLSFFLPGTKTNPIVKVNILFGATIPGEEKNQFMVISDIIVYVKCDDEKERNKWLSEILGTYRSIFECAVKGNIADRK